MARPSCLLTGANGFVGRNFADYLIASGYRVISICRRENAASDSFFPLLLNEQFPARLREVVEKEQIKHCIHLAGRINGSVNQIRSDNEEFTKYLLTCLKDYSDRMQFIYLSSVSAVEPVDEYGLSKRRAEELIEVSGFKRWLILRSSLLYGKYDKKNVAWLIWWVRHFPLIPILGGKNVKLQPLFVGDLYRVVESYLNNPEAKNGAYVVAGPKQEKLWDMVGDIKERYERHACRLSLPLKPVQWVAPTLNRIMPSLRLPVQQLRILSEHPPWNFQDAASKLGFAPRDFSEGLRELD